MAMTVKSELNSRAYRDFLVIANAAYKTIEKIKECATQSKQRRKDPNVERPDMEYIFFTIPQLRQICFDYAFSAWENFLEHLGFILFDDWDSKKKQKTYKQKYNRLLDFLDFISSNRIPNIDYSKLENEWKTIIQKIDPDKILLAKKRNPIKHVHSETHDIKFLDVDNNTNSSEAYEKITKNTRLGITDDDCLNIISNINDLINAAYDFLYKNQNLLKIHRIYLIDEKSKKRKSLWRTFLCHPLAVDFYSENRLFMQSA